MKFWLVRLLSILAAVGICFAIDFVSKGPKDEVVMRLVAFAGLYVTLAVSLNLINGITGQFSIGHAAFYMVGAYVCAYLSQYHVKNWGLDGPLLLLVLTLAGAAGAGIAGFVVGLPSLRLRGDYLAIVTLGFGEIIRIVVQNQPVIGGSYGMNFEPKYRLIWMIWLLAFVSIAVCRNLLKTAHGLPFLSVREDEVASSAMGVNVTKVKVTAFIIGSAFAGAAGAMLANYEGLVSPTYFPMELSFMILTMVVLGGTGSITGSAVAAVLLFYLPERLRDFPPVTGASLAAGVVAVIGAVVIIKRIADHYHGPRLNKALYIVGCIIAAVILQVILAMILRTVPALKDSVFEAIKLRMVIFAGTLIILMLLRPQGVFAHHEFSWSWVMKLFGKKHEEKAVAV